jgi:hypothetical protein
MRVKMKAATILYEVFDQKGKPTLGGRVAPKCSSSALGSPR